MRYSAPDVVDYFTVKRTMIKFRLTIPIDIFLFGEFCVYVREIKKKGGILTKWRWLQRYGGMKGWRGRVLFKQCLPWTWSNATW